MKANISRRKLLSVGSLGGLSLGLAACAGISAQTEQNVLNAINTACELVPIGTTLVAVLASSIPLAAPFAPIVQTVGQDISADCNAFVSAVGGAIAAINKIAGVATVTVSSSSSSPAAEHYLKSLAKRLKGHVKRVSSHAITFIVPPVSVF